jgi:hypothetical protein
VEDNNMENRKEISENIIKIIKKMNNYNKYILEYGFNSEDDIFIKEDMGDIKDYLNKTLNELKNEK